MLSWAGIALRASAGASAAPWQISTRAINRNRRACALCRSTAARPRLARDAQEEKRKKKQKNKKRRTLLAGGKGNSLTENATAGSRASASDSGANASGQLFKETTPRGARASSRDSNLPTTGCSHWGSGCLRKGPSSHLDVAVGTHAATIGGQHPDPSKGGNGDFALTPPPLFLFVAKRLGIRCRGRLPTEAETNSV